MMVVLVRCPDNTVVPALKARLGQLVRDGLISAILREGTWMPVPPPESPSDKACRLPAQRRTSHRSPRP